MIRRNASPRRSRVEPLEIRRLLSAGDLDASFGDLGKVLTDMPGSAAEQGWSVTVQPDGKTVVAGTLTRVGDPYGDMLVARYRTDGTPDPTFGGGDGWTTIDFSNRHDFAHAVRVAPGGKIVVAGYSAEVLEFGPPNSGWRETGKDFAVARLNADGSPDAGFDADGRRLVEFINPGQPALESTAFDVAVRGDGRVVLVGQAGSGGFAFAALRADGTPDPTFDGDGLLVNRVDSNVAQAVAVEMDAQGRFVVTGNRVSGFADVNRVTTARFLASGQIDTTFGGNGTGAVGVALGTMPQGFVRDLAIAADGKIVIAGSGAARFNANGTLDNSFSDDGGVTFGMIASGVVVEANGSVLVAGHHFAAAGDPELRRFRADGTPDTAYNGGVAGGDSARNGVGQVWDLALAPDGKSVTVGTLSLNHGSADPLTAPDLVLTRRLANGALDTTFGGGGDGDGVLVADFVGPSFNAVSDVLTLPDDKVLVVGPHWAGRVTSNGEGYDFALARYTAAGVLDAAFGAGGIVYTDHQGRADVPTSLALQSDGKILAAGRSGNDVLLVRYNPNGSVDATFGDAGRVVISTIETRPIAPVRAFAPADNPPPAMLAVLEDDRIVLATTTGGTTSDFRFALVRLAPSGAPDPTFGGGDGSVITTRFAASAAAVALSPGGKIVVAGNTGPHGSPGTVHVARFTSAGALDENRFGTQGYVTASGLASAVRAVGVGPDGAVTVGTTVGVTTEPRNNFIVLRFLADGQVDRFYGAGGKAEGDFGLAHDTLRDIALLPDGSVIAVGSSPMAQGVDARTQGDFALAKFTPQGTPDVTFGAGDGTSDAGMKVDFAGMGDAAHAVAVDSQGRIVVAGGAFVPGRSSDFALVRLEGSGPPAPHVVRVSAGASVWTEPFRAALQQQGIGADGGFLWQRTAFGPFMPWVGVDTFTVRFAGPVEGVRAADLRVRGTNVANYPVAGVTYDPATKTATWRLAQPVANDRLAVELNTDDDPEWEHQWRGSVLGGDATGDGGVTATDLAELRRRLNKSLANPGSLNTAYSVFVDVTGDGRINALDMAAVKQRLNRRLPSTGPALARVSATAELFAQSPILP